MPDLAILDAILDTHAAAIGDDLVAYRNHAHRVARLCLHHAGEGAETVEKTAIAAAFHDLGIWTDRTFDYLEPSVALAAGYLGDTGRPAWIPEIAAVIREHHKIRPYRGHPASLVEAFRRADWTDVTLGAVRFGAPRSLVRELYAAWPDAGFHRLLVRLELRHIRKHPLDPLPVLRW